MNKLVDTSDYKVGYCMDKKIIILFELTVGKNDMFAIYDYGVDLYEDNKGTFRPGEDNYCDLAVMYVSKSLVVLRDDLSEEEIFEYEPVEQLSFSLVDTLEKVEIKSIENIDSGIWNTLKPYDGIQLSLDEFM